jgi:hypothetical protein
MEEKQQQVYSIGIASVFCYFVLLLMLFYPFTVLFNSMWGEGIFILPKEWLYLILCLLGIAVHELIHAAFAALYSPNGFSNIKLGITKYLAAYCNLDEEIAVKHFRVIVIMPFLVLGVLPVIISLIFGWADILRFGLLLSAGSVGDIIMFCWLINKNGNSWVKEDSSQKNRLSIVVYKK